MENVREERLVSYRIYADRVWIMHTCINVLLLFLTAKLSGMTVRVRRIIEIAAGNALCFMAILLLPAPAVLQGEVGIILAGKTFFCLIAALWWVQRCFQVKSREGMRRVWICYMCCACVLGGVCNGISEVRELFETDQNGFGTGGQVSMMQLLVWCAIVVWYGAKLLDRERRRQKHPIWKVSFFWKTKFFSGSALMDSGNSLKDPYTGRPVCVLDEETAKKLGISTEKAVRLIPYHSIGRAHGLLRAVTVSELYLRKDGQEKKIADVTVAVGPGRLSRSGGYQMILHPALLEEKKGADHDIKSSDAGKSAV